MKPLPTLTKPLRSVDIATHEPAQALRERTDSCTVPAAGVVGEAMVALVLADAYRSKFGGDHIDDVREAVRAYEDRIGWHRLGRPQSGTSGPQMALVLIGFMGAGKSTAAPSWRERAGRNGRSTATSCWWSASGTRSRTSSSCTARRLSARPRSSWCAGCWRALTPRDVIALGGGSVLSARVRAALTGHTTALIEVEPEIAWERVRPRRRRRAPAGARPRGASRALYAQRRGLYEEARRCGPAGAESASAPVFIGTGPADGRRALAARSPRACACCGRVSPRAALPVLAAGRHALRASSSTASASSRVAVRPRRLAALLRDRCDRR